VVEHLREQGWWVKITYLSGIFRDAWDQPGYQVEFRNVSLERLEQYTVDGLRDEMRDRIRLHKFGESTSLPESICLAALEVAKEMNREGRHARP
jgi:hypothetical protein